MEEVLPSYLLLKCLRKKLSELGPSDLMKLRKLLQQTREGIQANY